MRVKDVPKEHRKTKVGRKILVDEDRITKSLVMESYYDFIKEFWDVVVQTKPVWNWHIEHAANEVQMMYERIFKNQHKEYDLVYNQPPATTKSLVFSVFSLPWAWTRMPSFRQVGCSYSMDPVATDLSRYARSIVKSEKYQRLFPDIVVSREQDTKHYFTNTKGGQRYCTGVMGAVTSKHFHCLPFDSRIVTEDGLSKIGWVVENKTPVRVMSYDHANNRVRWSKILQHEKFPGGMLDRITFDDGTTLEMTDEHPVYVVGKGYVPCKNVQGGDRVHTDSVSMSSLRQEGLQVRPPRGGSETGSLLRQELFLGVHYGTESPHVPQTCQEEVRKVRGHVQDEESRQNFSTEVLLPDLCGEEGGRKPTVRQKEKGSLSQLRKGSAAGEETSQTRSVLFTGVCGQTALQADEGGGELQLRSRTSGEEVQEEVLQTQGESPQTGETQVLSLSEEGTERVQSVCPSHRLRQRQQPDGQLRGSVQTLSREDARQQTPQAVTLGTKTVSHVERAVRHASAVYNIEVAEDHNYFAQGVLVHNSVVIDDPLSPQEALSDAEVERTNRWITDTLMSRKVDENVAVVQLVMQRLRQNDPSAMMAGLPNTKQIILPATTEFPIFPPELEKFYCDGLLDPTRLSRKTLANKKAGTDEYGYASQYGQQPVPLGGGMFMTKLFKYSTYVPPMLRTYRFWDKANTKNRGAFTVGVKMGVDKYNGYWVLDVVRGRWDTHTREVYIRETARRDGRDVFIGLEQEPGSGAKESNEKTVARLAGFKVKSIAPKGDKEMRAVPFSSQVNAANVTVARDTDNKPFHWEKDYVEELAYFPFSTYKDQVDASSGCFTCLSTVRRRLGAI